MIISEGSEETNYKRGNETAPPPVIVLDWGTFFPRFGNCLRWRKLPHPCSPYSVTLHPMGGQHSYENLFPCPNVEQSWKDIRASKSPTVHLRHSWNCPSTQLLSLSSPAFFLSPTGIDPKNVPDHKSPFWGVHSGEPHMWHVCTHINIKPH